jgi:hypothetical protein
MVSADKSTGRKRDRLALRSTWKVGNRKGIDTILAALLMVVIVVVAAVMVYAWSTGLLGTLLVNPNNNKEGPLTLDTSGAFPSANNVTLYIRNGGTLGVTLNSFYITDSYNDLWQAISWTAGPSINPNAVVSVTISVPTVQSGPNCYVSIAGAASTATTCSYVAGSGTYQSGFFQPGQYTVKVITSRNNPFTFTVTK